MRSIIASLDTLANYFESIKKAHLAKGLDAIANTIERSKLAAINAQQASPIHTKASATYLKLYTANTLNKEVHENHDDASVAKDILHGLNRIIAQPEWAGSKLGDYCRWLGIQLRSNNISIAENASPTEIYGLIHNAHLAAFKEETIHDALAYGVSVINSMRNNVTDKASVDINAKMTPAQMESLIKNGVAKSTEGFSQDELKHFNVDRKEIPEQPLDKTSDNQFLNGSIRWYAVTNEKGEYLSGCSVEGKVGGHCGNGVGSVTKHPSLLSLRNANGFQGMGAKNTYATLTVDEELHVNESKGNGNRHADLKDPAVQKAFEWLYVESGDVKGYSGGGYQPLTNTTPLKTFGYDVDKVEELERKTGKKLISDLDRQFVDAKKAIDSGEKTVNDYADMENMGIWDAIGVKPEEVSNICDRLSADALVRSGASNKFITDKSCVNSLVQSDITPLSLWAEVNFKIPGELLSIFVRAYKLGDLTAGDAVKSKIDGKLGDREYPISNESLVKVIPRKPALLGLWDGEYTKDLIDVFAEIIGRTPQNLTLWKGVAPFSGKYPEEFNAPFARALITTPSNLSYWNSNTYPKVFEKPFLEGLKKNPGGINFWNGTKPEGYEDAIVEGLKIKPSAIQYLSYYLTREFPDDVKKNFSIGLKSKPHDIKYWLGEYPEEFKQAFAEGLKENPRAIREWIGEYPEEFALAFIEGLKVNPSAIKDWVGDYPEEYKDIFTQARKKIF